MAKAQTLGICGYINKPILKNELASKVRALIDEKQEKFSQGFRHFLLAMIPWQYLFRSKILCI